MPDEYVANCQISMPIAIPNVTPEIDLNGVMFSYTQGLMYLPGDVDPPMRLPEGL